MDIRPSPIAGKWYPASADHLREMIQRYLQPAPPQSYDRLYGLLTPHAGLRYSGPVAGYSFRHLQPGQFDLVVIVAPSHYPYPAEIITTGHEAFQTPLGTVPVDVAVITELVRQLDVLPVRTDPEHAIEIELPFLQETLGDFALVPIALLDQSYATARRLANVLIALLEGRNALLVASSDLSHFYDHATARQLDQTVLEAIAAYQPEMVLKIEEEGRGFACGRGAITAVMLAAQKRGATVATIEHYATSGETSGDFSRVVGYGAATFHN